MDIRFKLAAVGFFAAMMLLSNANHEVMQGFGGVFVALGALLIFAVVALFPSLNRGDRADRGKAGGAWSDRIEFEEPVVSEKSDGSWR